MNTLPDEQAQINPLEDQRKQALEHYREISSQACNWSSFVEVAIKAYAPVPGKEEIYWQKRCEAAENIIKVMDIPKNRTNTFGGNSNEQFALYRERNHIWQELIRNKPASPSTASNEHKIPVQYDPEKEVNSHTDGEYLEDYSDFKPSTSKDEPKAVQAAKEYMLKFQGSKLVQEAFLAGASFNSKDEIEVHVHGISKQKSDAVYFAEWILKEGYYTDGSAVIWFDNFTHYTTQELYNLFKQIGQ